MKYLLPLFLVTKLWGQAFTPQDLPWLANVQSPPLSKVCPLGTGSFNFGSIASGTLKVELFSCNATNSATNNTILLAWADLSGNNNTFTWVGSPGSGQASWDLIGAGQQTPSGLPTVSFQRQPGDGENLRCVNNLAISQPYTIFIANKDSGANNTFVGDFHSFFDTWSGGRALYQDTAIGSAGRWSAGTLLNPAPSHLTTWTVWAFVFDGASSTVETNNVLFTSGNPGAAALGQMMIGSDNTFNSESYSRWMSCLVYSGHLTPADRTTVVNNLRAIGGF